MFSVWLSFLKISNILIQPIQSPQFLGETDGFSGSPEMSSVGSYITNTKVQEGFTNSESGEGRYEHAASVLQILSSSNATSFHCIMTRPCFRKEPPHHIILEG